MARTRFLTTSLSFTVLLGALVGGCQDGKEATVEASPPSELRVAVEVTEDGYRPLEVDAKAGVPLTMVFTRTTDADCGKKVVVPDFGIERELPVNVPVEVSFTPEHTGRIGFMCGMGQMKGAILVQ